LPADQRPVDPTPVHTVDLPPTPIRDRNIPASAWVEAPDVLLRSGDDIPGPDGRVPEAMYKRRIGRWLLWRSGPAKGGNSRYVAIDSDDLDRSHEFRLLPDGTGDGVARVALVTPGSGRGRKTCGMRTETRRFRGRATAAFDRCQSQS
ncbi:MAG: hypothetical protein ACHQDC_09265, partial [Acidimicrobiales bacterium]